MSPEIRKELMAAPRCQWALFTSANAVNCFFSLLAELNLDARHLKGVKVGAIGDVTAEALRRNGIVADAVPATFVQEKLAAAVAVEAGQRVLLPRAGSGRENLERELRLRGADVRVVPVYDTVGDRHGIAAMRHELTQGRIHLVTFTSASTFERFAESVKAEDLPRLFSDVIIATIGPITSEAVKAGGLKVDIEASHHTADGMVEEILSYFRKNRPPRADETWT
jgi:uroporphyrinogen III methyltransferase/synthase